MNQSSDGNNRPDGDDRLGVWDASLEDRAGFVSQLFLNYLTPLLKLGAKKTLEDIDVGVPSKIDLAGDCYESARKAWEDEIERARFENDKRQRAYEAALAKCSSDDQKQKIKVPVVVEPKLTPALMKSFGMWRFFLAAGLYACSIILQFVPVFILEDLVRFFEAGASTENYQGYAHPWVEVVGLAVFPLLIAIFQTQNQVIMAHGATFVRTVASIMLYRKSLRVSAAGRAKTSTGQVVNMMSNDTTQLQRVMLFASMTLVAPFQIIAALGLIYRQVGNATWVGLAFMIVLMPLNSIMFSYVSKFRRDALKYSDLRVKMMNEILSGIRVIKFYAWERPFGKEVARIRGKEVNALTRLAYTSSVGVSLVLTSVPLVQPVLVFATYMMIQDEPLSAATAFTTIALFNMMRIPFVFLPLGLLQFLQGKIAVGRLERYLYLPELNEYVEPNAPPQGKADSLGPDDSVIQSFIASITMKGSFGWVDPNAEPVRPIQDEKKKKERRSSRGKKSSSEGGESAELSTSIRTAASIDESQNKASEITLQDLDHTIEAGSLVACVGSVGSGKSSLLSAILGEMEPMDGAKVYIPRPEGETKNEHFVSYCSQTPWVLNDTLRGNILFGREFVQERYDQVLDACALLDDLAILPAGDMTEIGERGINLSGGQKARVSLARALYSRETRIMLLDDPLSAVDAHVGEHIFSTAIAGDLVKDVTRVLVTHHVHVLQRCDCVIVMEEGRIKHMGKYEDLLAQGVDFTGALDVSKKDDDEKDEDADKENNNNDDKADEKGESSSEDAKKNENDDNALPEEHSKKEIKAGQNLTQNEEREEGSVSGSTYVHYARAGGLLVFVGVLLLLAAAKGMEIGNNFWLSAWAAESTKALLNGENFTDDDTRFYLGIYSALGIGGVLMVTFESVVLAYHRLRASKRLHDDLTVSVLRAPVAFFDVTPMGRILNRFAADMDKVDLELTQSLSHGLSTAFSVIGAVSAIIAATKGTFLIPLLPLALIYYLIQKWFRKTSTELQRLNSIANSPIFADFSQTLNGCPTIRAYGEEQRFADRCLTSFDTMNASYVLIQMAFYWLAIRLDMLGGFVGAFIAAIAMATSNSSFSIPAGWVGLALSYSIEVTQMFKHGVRTIAQLEAQMNSVERLLYYSNNIDAEAPEEIPEKDPPEGTWPVSGEIEFKGASMRYRDGPLVLKDISLTFRGGEKVGVCGRTGSGKSSLMVCLFRITEIENDGGTVSIDGVNTLEIGTTVLRRNLSIIPQDPTMFSNTVRYNLDPFGAASETEIWDVLAKVQMKDVVEALPLRLEEAVAEGGENFSQGQRQLICIARALLQKPRILVMDEATASIDNATDALIQKMIRENFKDATVLTIAHRLNTIMDCDRVLVLDGGKIVEFDSPEKLLQKPDGHFHSMVEKSRSAMGMSHSA